MPKEDIGVAKPLSETSKIERLFIPILVVAVILGLITGYYFNTKSSGPSSNPLIEKQAQTAGEDSKTFRDFAEGTIKTRPEPKNNDEYVEGTHLLMRDAGSPVALTSSVVDLSKYEGKKVRVLGETQKAIKEGWLMDVGKVEEIK
jgi:hypothetical protein